MSINIPGFTPDPRNAQPSGLPSADRIATALERIADALERPHTDRLPELVDIAQRGLDRVAASFRPTGSPNDSRLAMQDLAMELRAALDAKPCDDRTCTDRDHWAPRDPNQCDPGCTRPSLHDGDCDDAGVSTARVPWDGCESRAGDARGSGRRVADRCGETFNDSSAAEERVWVCTETVGHVGYHYDAARLVGWGKKLPSMTPGYAAAILSRQTEPDPLDEWRTGVHIAEGMTVRIIGADGSTRVGTVGEMVEADGLTNWTLIPDDEPDPLDEDDHRPRHDRDGDHWHKGPHGWTSEGPTGHGDDRLDWLADSYGPLTFCDCDDATIEAENGATD